ncbi:MAG: thioredoxin [Hyphomicrobiales bacterium]
MDIKFSYGNTPPADGKQAGNGNAGELVKDVTDATFMADVIEASQTVPVIVDFWAPWCGPCKQLTPALEKIIQNARGAVKLVKINVDENPQIAGQMRVQSIPAVFAFKNGQPVDGFMGALPESQIKEFVSKLTDGADGSAEIAAAIEAGNAALEAGDVASAAQAFSAVLQADRENTEAIAGLARAQILAEDFDGAEATLAMAPADKADDQHVTSARTTLELAKAPVDTGEITELSAKVEADPKDHQARIDLSIALNAAGRREDALEQLLESIRLDRAWNEDAARKQLLQFFEAWGHADELTVAGRRGLSSILFS